MFLRVWALRDAKFAVATAFNDGDDDFQADIGRVVDNADLSLVLAANALLDKVGPRQLGFVVGLILYEATEFAVEWGGGLKTIGVGFPK